MTTRALLYRSGALGDTLLCLPTLDALRCAYPDAHITFAAHPAYAAPLMGDGRIEALLDAGAPPFHLLHTAPAISLAGEDDELTSLLKSFNPIILFTRDPDGAAPKRLAALEEAETFIAQPFPPEGSRQHVAEWALSAHVAHAGHGAPKANISISGTNESNQSIRIQTVRHTHLKRPKDTRAPLSGSQVTAPAPLKQSPKIQQDAANYLKRIGAPAAPLLAIHPGGGGRPQWPPTTTLLALALHYCEKLEATPLLITGPADEEPTRAFARAFEKAWGVEILRLVSPPLDILSAVLARAAAYIGGDSGIAPLAALSGAPSLALFGPASDPARWAPIGPRAAFIFWDNPDEGIKKLDELTDLNV